MKMNLTAAISLLALMLLGGAMVSYAQGPGDMGPGHGPGPMMGGMHGGPGGPMGHMFRELNLTDAQKQQVKSLMDANKTSMHTLMLQMEQNRLAMLQATTGGAYDAAKVQALATQQAQLQAAITVQHEAMQHQVYTQVLTAEQRTKFDQMQAEHITRMTEHIQKMASGNQAAPAQ